MNESEWFYDMGGKVDKSKRPKKYVGKKLEKQVNIQQKSPENKSCDKDQRNLLIKHIST